MLEYTYSALREFSIGPDNIIVYPDKVTITAPKITYIFRLPSPAVHIFRETIDFVQRVIIISQANENASKGCPRQDSVISRGENSWRHRVVSNLVAFTSRTYYYIEDGILLSENSRVFLDVLTLGPVSLLFDTFNLTIIGTTIYLYDNEIYTLAPDEKLDYVFCDDQFIHFHIRPNQTSPYYLTLDSHTGRGYPKYISPFIQITSSTTYTLFNHQADSFTETLKSDGKSLSINPGDDISWYGDKLLYMDNTNNKFRIFSEFDFEFVNYLTSYYKAKLLYQLWLLQHMSPDHMPPKLVWLYKIYPYT